MQRLGVALLPRREGAPRAGDGVLVLVLLPLLGRRRGAADGVHRHVLGEAVGEEVPRLADAARDELRVPEAGGYRPGDHQ